MRYAVFGPRDFEHKLYTNYEHVAGCLNSIAELTGIIHGGGRGIEALAHDFAVARGWEPTIIRPNFEIESGITISPVQAFDNRNILIIQQADAIAMFWDAQYSGMVVLLQRSIALKKKVILYPMI